MNKIFDRLNLRPQERRLVVIVAIVVFVVINFWLVIPMFGEYGKNQQRMGDAQKNVDRYKAEIGKKQLYQKQLNDLQAQGSSIPSEDAALRLYQEVNSQANLTGLGYTSISQATRGGSGGKTNAFFDETSVTVSVRTGEKELIDFLNRLTDKDMMIRAKSMNISPELPGRNSLQGSITLVKSFQRKPPVKAAGPAAARAAAKTNAPAPAPKPAPVAVTPPSKPVSATPAVEKKTGRTAPSTLPPASGSMTNRTKRTP